MKFAKEFGVRRVFRYYLLGIATLIVIIYTLLLKEYFGRGLEQAMTVEMYFLAQDYDQRLANNPEAELPSGLYVQSYRDWSEVPEPYQSRLDQSELVSANLEVLFRNETSEPKAPRDIYFLFPFHLSNDEWLYITRHPTPGALQHDVRHQIWRIRVSQVILALAVILSVIILTHLFLLYVGRRVDRLAHWAHNLNLDTLTEKPPQMGFAEFSDIAEKLHSAFARLRTALQREKDFLRHASHELRTPIAVVRNNVELLQRRNPPEELTPSLARIERAAYGMQSMTETLLWLGREQREGAPRRDEDLAAAIREQIDFHRYLLHSKQVSVTLEVPQTCVTPIAITPWTIISANLVRNAFQHTAAGSVTVTLNENSLVVLNVDEEVDGHSDATEREESNRIGLKLCQEIAEAMAWSLQIERRPDGMRVELRFEGVRIK
ncbi:HAMP domain-containing histidine kinase [Hahella sp. KA22]|uniref:sensor histidine kinase n=1 Tax=Hahella sp. KA22 TaxID=1628392 RepID=UPI000FDD9107|nr:HAMP domain-containing sensor histidine kinase [Hahella sp. KA22]AZZ91980.1 HAMP domain-containing histidine kinase [Hahella sp. KA22]QAY55351.1 HAMP domain-containing histidine kinase [Hahella sp. KA22]